MRPLVSSPYDSTSSATLSPSAIALFTVILRPLLRRPSMVWKRPEILSFVYRPAAGEASGLPGMSQVASSVMVAITPAMSLAVKHAQTSPAATVSQRGEKKVAVRHETDKSYPKGGIMFSGGENNEVR